MKDLLSTPQALRSSSPNKTRWTSQVSEIPG